MIIKPVRQASIEAAPPGRVTGVAVVTSCYKFIKHVDDLVVRYGPHVDAIYAVDNKCPENPSFVVVQRVPTP